MIDIIYICHNIFSNLSHLDHLHGLLSSPDVELRITAGETIALLLEVAYDHDEEYEPDGLENLVDSLRQLSTDSQKYRSKKDRKEQRSSFREVLKTVEDGESPSEQVTTLFLSWILLLLPLS